MPKNDSILFIICLLILALLALMKQDTGSYVDEGLIVKEWHYGIGLDEEEQTTLSYTINVTNTFEKKMKINAIMPVIDEKLQDRVMAKETLVEVNKAVESNDTLAIEGEILIDTKGLSKAELERIQPAIVGVKIVSEEVIKLGHDRD